MQAVERLVNLIAFLLNTRHPATAAAIRESVAGYGPGQTDEAFNRMFERDKAALRELDIPLVTKEDDQGEGAYTIDHAAYYLPPIQVEPDEALALRISAALLASDPGYPLGEEIRTAFAKLASVHDAPGGERANISVCLAPETSDRLTGENLAVLRKAADARKLVSFDYYSISADSQGARRVEPYGLFNLDGHWYFVGHCHTAGAVRTFRLSRVVGQVGYDESTVSKPDFSVPEDFRLDHYVRRPWEIGQRSFPATVDFAPRLAPWARLNLCDSAQLRTMPGGAVRATLDCRDEERFLRWVLSFGTGALIVEPPALHKTAAAKLEAALARYGRDRT